MNNESLPLFEQAATRSAYALECIAEALTGPTESTPTVPTEVYLAIHDAHEHMTRYATNSCTDASDDFLKVLDEYGIEGLIEHFDMTLEVDLDDYPLKDFKIGAWWKFHWAVRVGDVIVDWTARQFDPKAPFPLVFLCPKREWRNDE